MIPSTNRPSMYEPPESRLSRALRSILRPDYVVGVILTGLVIGCLAWAIWRVETTPLVIHGMSPASKSASIEPRARTRPETSPSKRNH